MMKTVLLLLFAWTVSAQDPCKRQFGSCACETSKGWINLKPLDNNNTATPRFVDVDVISDPTNDDTFSYNPCSDFSYKCTNVAVCQDHYSLYYPLGDQKSATFSTSGDVTITYKAMGNDGTERTSVVKLVCAESQDHELTADEEQGSPPTFYFTLTTKWACPGIAPAPEGAGSSGGLSPGSVMLIIFFVVCFIYILVGILYNKYHRGAQGKELVPHVSFWTSLPSLAADGAKFSVGKVKGLCGKGGGRPGYDEF